ncbi:MAG TPA: ketopantoate reductase family protein [Vicinamibacteria bacterium]
MGTGAMACLFAARLQRFGGAPVTLTGTWTEALDKITADGIRVDDEAGCWSVRPDVVPRAGPHRPADLVLVLVKGYQTREVAPVVAHALRPGGHVLTLQNGLGNRETLEAATGAGRVSVGIATLGATLLGPAQVRATPGEVVLGAGDAPPAGILDFERLLSASRFVTRLEPDIDVAVWRKLAVNCAINPLSALVGCPNGGLLRSPEPRETLIAAAREVGAVAAALGIQLGADPGALALAVAETTAANRSSMLQDVARGAPTEIDSLNGAVVEKARQLGVPVPVNESLLRGLREAAAPRQATA